MQTETETKKTQSQWEQELLASCTPQVQDIVKKYLDSNDLWKKACAFGFALRTREPETGEAAKKLVEDLLTKKPIESHVSIKWAKQWSPDERSEMLRHFTYTASLLARNIEDVLEREADLDLVHIALMGRDELQSVYVLLCVHDTCELEKKMLKAIDKVGSKHAYSVPCSLRTFAHMKVALASDPFTWWCASVSELESP